MIAINEFIKILLTILCVPIVILILLIITILAIHYVIHEALWKNKESKD